eukprot:GFYU01002929.1.p1 GENE.GFYU01002929.1~~GFYU01002929.1.p1  ORF type:complete len:339 (-),score=78.95 GFYU01002929.1:40-1056(-)
MGDEIEQEIVVPPIEEEEVEGQPLSLEELSNSLSEISKTFDGNGYSYAKLTVEGLSLGSLDAIVDYPLLMHLELSNNSLDDSCLKQIERLPQLVSVNLSHNRFKTALECTALRYLKSLNLSHNRIEAINAIPHTQLKVLNLSHNRLTEINGLSQLQQLQTLDVTYNKLTGLAGLSDDGPLECLEALYAGYNAITALGPFGLRNLPALKTLHLRKNEFETLDAFTHCELPQLYSLNIRENKLEAAALIEPLQSLPALRKLMVKENPMADGDGYRVEILSFLLKMRNLDKEPFTLEDIEAAREMRATRDEERRVAEEERRAAEEEARLAAEAEAAEAAAE